MKATTLSISAFIATATVTASNAGTVKVVNRCSYDVSLWSVNKEIGCAASTAVVLKQGEAWSKQMNITENADDGGVSIKLSKYSTCAGYDITQLEYKITGPSDNPTEDNYLDMSFVDCQRSGNCPGFKDGYYLKAGNNGNEVQKAASNNEHCPIFSVANAAEAAKVAYILPDDRQTKWCTGTADLELYLCGSQAPGSDDESASSSAVASSSSSAPSSIIAPSSSTSSSKVAVPTTTSKATFTPSTSTEDLAIAKAAAVTPAPEPEAPKAVKTVIEYVTVSVDAPVKRHAHAHAHARRHQRIRA